MSKKKGNGPNSSAPGTIGAPVQGAAKEKAWVAALSELELAYGQGSIMRLGDQAHMTRDLPGLSPGSVPQD